MTSRFVTQLKDVTIIRKKKAKDEAAKPASKKIGTVTPQSHIENGESDNRFD